MQATPPRFDHAVVSARDRLDAVEACYRRLGFQVTPRGHHTLGSINHLIVLGRSYIELLGYPPGREDARPELAASRPGLDALVFGTPDAAATRGAALARGAPVQPVQSFSRPVEIDGRVHDARFRTVRLPASFSPTGRLYFCEHQTPELVWHHAWQQHANDALELVRVDVSARDPDAEAARYRTLLGAQAVRAAAATEGGGSGAPGGPDDLLRYLVHAPPVTIALRRSPDLDRMTAMTLRVGVLSRTRAALSAGGVAFTDAGNAVVVAAADAGGVELRFGEE